MLSKNTTRGARGQPELNAARLRNAQQVGHKLAARDGEGAGAGKEEWQTDRQKQQASPTSAFFPESSTTTDDIWNHITAIGRNTHNIHYTHSHSHTHTHTLAYTQFVV